MNSLSDTFLSDESVNYTSSYSFMPPLTHAKDIRLLERSRKAAFATERDRFLGIAEFLPTFASKAASSRSLAKTGCFDRLRSNFGFGLSKPRYNLSELFFNLSELFFTSSKLFLSSSELFLSSSELLLATK